MGIQAARRGSRVGGGYRAYVLGKSLDVKGWGMVRRDDLQAYALSLGVNIRTWQRWINEARKNDLLKDIQKGEDWFFILPSAAKAGIALGLEHIGSRKARMSAGALVSKGWKARVFSAWEDGKQISRQQIQKAINVSRSTQKYRDRTAGTLRTRNYSKSEMRPDKLTGIKEYSNHKAPFVMRDGFIAWRLPDTRFSTSAARAGKGRARKANAAIRKSLQIGLSNMRQALGNVLAGSGYVRLFNQTKAQRRQTERKLSKGDLPIRELYERAREAKTGAVMWSHCPVS
jgi:hypothetical protein